MSISIGVSFLTVRINYTNMVAGSWIGVDNRRWDVEGTGMILHTVLEPGVYQVSWVAMPDATVNTANVTLPDNNWPLLVAGVDFTVTEAADDPNVFTVLHNFGPYQGMLLQTQLFGDTDILAGSVTVIQGLTPAP